MELPWRSDISAPHAGHRRLPAAGCGTLDFSDRPLRTSALVLVFPVIRVNFPHHKVENDLHDRVSVAQGYDGKVWVQVELKG